MWNRNPHLFKITREEKSYSTFFCRELGKAIEIENKNFEK